MNATAALASTKLVAGKSVGFALMGAGGGLMAPLLVSAVALSAAAYAGFRFLTWPRCEKCARGLKPHARRSETA